MAEAAEVSIEIDGEPITLESQLREFNWYLGTHTTTEAALLILRECTLTNCFVVYKQPMQEDYTISTKTVPTGTNVNMYEHFKISKDLSGQYTLHGKKLYTSNNFLQLVDSYCHGFLPPLVPAVDVKVAELNKKNPTVALQPNSGGKRSLSVQVSGSSLGSNNDEKKLLSTAYVTSPITGSVQPQWNYNQDKSTAHPQNFCHGCCYRKQEWNGSEYSPVYAWYDVRGNGPLRLAGLLMFWLTCGACFGLYRGIKYARVVVTHACCNLYDEEQ